MNDGILGLIGNTPLVRVQHLDTGPCELYLKLENQNPGGSIKDRIGLAMITAAEKAGKLGPQQPRLVEATAGNTGIGLAVVAALKGYQLTLVIPDKMSLEKIAHLRALGAQVRITRSDVGKGHPAYYQDMAERLARETGAFYVNQFSNPANPQAHEDTTGPEIARQMDMRLDAVVLGVGSGGTLTGLSRYFAKALPNCELVLADPKGSVLADYVHTGKLGQAGSWVVEGIGEDFIPDVCDLSRVKQAYTVTDTEALTAVRELLRKEGVLAGSSTGVLLAAALRYCREQKSPKRVVTLVCDSGNKYLSKQFDDNWMTDQGFLPRPRYGDLRDLVTRRHEDGAVVTLDPADTLLTALNRMKVYGVSQLPVLEGGRVVGMVDESDLLLSGARSPARLRDPVRGVMSTRLKTVGAQTTPEELVPLFDAGFVPIVMDDHGFVGLITRIDVLSALRRRLDDKSVA